MREIKTITAVQMKKKFPFLVSGYFDSSTIWSIGYFVSTVGINEKVIQRYIEMQGKEDSGQASLDLDWCYGRKPVDFYLVIGLPSERFFPLSSEFFS